LFSYSINVEVLKRVDALLEKVTVQSVIKKVKVSKLIHMLGCLVLEHKECFKAFIMFMLK